jgi:hypothetical protein
MEQPEGVGNSCVRLIGLQRRCRKTRRGRQVFRKVVDSTRVGRLSDSDAAPRDASVKAERTGTEGKDLEQAACHHHVLEEVDHLILVCKVVVERDCRG